MARSLGHAGGDSPAAAKELGLRTAGERHHDAGAFETSPTNPRNWPTRRKCLHMAVLSVMTFVTCLSPAIFAPALAQTMAEFDESVGSKLASLVIAVYVAGWASGPVIVAPLSELYGRLWVYHASNVLFVGFSAGCAGSRSLAMLIVFRFLAGCFGSAVLNIGGGTVADLYKVDSRGKAMTVWTVGALLGPIAGPIIGGFLAQRHGWRSTLWLVTAAGAFATILFAAVMRETYHPTLARRHGLALASGEGLDDVGSPRHKFAAALKRPLLMLMRSPVVTLSSLYIAVVYGYQYIIITTLPGVLQQRAGFSTSSVGLGYLGLGIGMMTSLAVFGACSDPLLRLMARRAPDGKTQPEHRLLPLLVSTPLVPAGIFVYGFAAEKRLHWSVILLGTGLLGAGLNATLMSLQTFLIDAFTLYAASVLAASTILRSLFGAFLPLAAPDLFASLGLGWGCALFGFLALLFIPMPVVFIKYGAALRQKGFLRNMS